MKRLFMVAACVAAASHAGAQTRWEEFRTAEDRALLDRLIRAEDARARTDADLATLRQGLAARNPALRRAAARGVGRLERADLLGDITPLLADSDATVRRAAADALAQGASREGAAAARRALVARLDQEQDPTVLAVIGESLGRLQPADARDAGATAEMLARLSDDTRPAVLRGAARGLFFLTRRAEARGAIPAPVVTTLRRLLQHNRTSGADADAYIRALAAAALVASGGSTVADVDVMLSDPDASVREKAIGRLPTLGDTAFVRAALLLRALRDPAPIVRFRAIPVYVRALRASDGCAPLVSAARDVNAHVAIAAIDALSGCRGSSGAVTLLDTIVSRFARDTAQWHKPAHALVAQAAVAPGMARARAAAFVSSANPFVRTYAVQAARQLDDTATLRRLAEDRDSNVRSEAIDALSTKVAHAADATYERALESNDSQLLMSAARALRGARNTPAATALAGALDRVTALKRETSRDARVAMLDAIRTTGDQSLSERLRPYLRDFDPQVARSASDILAVWTGSRPEVSVMSLPANALPPAATLGALGTARATIEMADGGRIVLRLFPLDAPSNVWRFVNLARAGYFDGLTWHRVVPYFVVQGGSPRANEYVGDGPFTRDEVGIENRRGTVGLSTRGRDTGDGQLYFNTVDNVRLDHDYTILAEVVSGMDVVDRLQEGAKIARIVVTAK